MPSQHLCPGEWRNPEGEVQDAGVGRGRVGGKAPLGRGPRADACTGAEVGGWVSSGGQVLPQGLGTVLKAQGTLADEHPLVMKIGQGGWREVPLSKSHPRGWKRKASERSLAG